eukprot:g9580.t1
MSGNANSIHVTCVSDTSSNNARGGTAAAGCRSCSASASTGPSPKRLRSAHRGTLTAQRLAPLSSCEMSRERSTASWAREVALKPEDRAFHLRLKTMEQAEAQRERDHVEAEMSKARDHEIRMAELRLAEKRLETMCELAKTIASVS